MPQFINQRRKDLGFTLLEVMVALFILAVVTGAMSKSARQATQNVQQLELRQHAAWVANNQLGLILLGSESKLDGEVSFAGHDFYWKAAVANTELETFSKVTVEVSPKHRRDYLLAQLTGFKQ